MAIEQLRHFLCSGLVGERGRGTQRRSGKYLIVELLPVGWYWRQQWMLTRAHTGLPRTRELLFFRNMPRTPGFVLLPDDVACALPIRYSALSIMIVSVLVQPVPFSSLRVCVFSGGGKGTSNQPKDTNSLVFLLHDQLSFLQNSCQERRFKMCVSICCGNQQVNL